MPSQTPSSQPNPLLAVFLAWVVPGLGHVYLRRRARGLVILFTVGLTFWTGVALGGAMTVQPDGEYVWWFAADMATGVHGLSAWRLQKRAYAEVIEEVQALQRATNERSAGEYPDYRIDRQLAEKGLALVAPMDTVARAYSGVAGLLNLLCIFDALMLALMRQAGEPPLEPAGAAPAKEASP